MTRSGRGQHHGEIATKILEELLERDRLDAVEIMETPVDAPDHRYAIGGRGQLRSGLGIRRRPALQRKQGYDHLRSFNSR